MIHSLLLFVWLALCAVQDIRQRRIANRLTWGGLLLALVYLLWSGSTWLGAPAAEGGWACALALLFTLPGYALGRLGAGDVKLLAALALATDSHYLLGTFIGAGLASAGWLLLAPRLWPLLNQEVRYTLRYLQPQASGKQPFAPFLLAGFALAWAWIPLVVT
ncbi:prepilin peptidase [Pseudomonas sp. S35]|uniref:prepilin peptidase n=1 Tax=Pseudomonas sp. S35 TaxID=1573719 RepID=UPI00132F0844|nr:prepilin peptidase [Pseudomonas sp. S35]QHF42857.1 prepilin peptidase [Pseudomonas sp. S35]